LRTGLRPTLEDENGTPLVDLGLLAKPTRLAIVPWLLVFFIGGASSSRFSAARRPGRSLRARTKWSECGASACWLLRKSHVDLWSLPLR
jgi:hypothetical protein